MPGVDGVDALAACLLAQEVDQSLGNAVDAAYCGYNPNLVANTDIAVLAAIAHERAILALDAQFLVDGMISVVQRSREISLQIVFVHPIAGFQILTGMADGIAVLDDVLTLLHVLDEYLVSCRCILIDGDA